LAVTLLVAIENVALVAPAATVTLPGTVAAVLLSASVTTAPPAGAAALNVTVPCDDVPPTTVDGLTTSELGIGSAGAVVTMRDAICATHPTAAVTPTTVPNVTGAVEIVKLALVCPGGTVTDGGTVTGA
jgi:hypothetical protein